MKRSSPRHVRTTRQPQPIRRISYDKTHPACPYKARMRIGDRRVDLGRYHTKAEARAAEKGARKVQPFRTPQRVRIPEEECQAIRETFQRTGSQRKTALAHGIARATVQVILWEAP
jgi:hypothetical protein